MGIFPMQQQANPWDNDPIAARAPTQPQTSQRPSSGVTVQPYGEVPSSERRANEDHEMQRGQNEIDNAERDADNARTLNQNTWARMTPEEVAAAGLPAGVAYQRNGLGEMKTIGGQATVPIPRITNPDRAPQISNMLGVLGRLREQADDFMAVGSSSEMWRNLPLVGPYLNQNRSNVEANLQTIQGDLIQQQLALMAIANNGSGVTGMGNSETEAARIAAAIAPMNPDQTPEEFLIGVQMAEDYYLRELIRSGGAIPDAYQSRARELAQSSAPPAGGTTPAGSVPNGGGPNGGGGVTDIIQFYDADGQPVGLDYQGTLFYEDGTPAGSAVRVTYDPAEWDAEGNYIGGEQNPINDPTQPEEPLGVMGQLGAGVGDIVQGAGDIIGIGANPIGQLMYNAMGINEQYDAGQILRDASGLPDNPNELANMINRGVTGTLLSGGAANLFLRTASNPTTRGVLGVIGNSPVRDAVAGGAAGAGAYFGEQVGGTPGALIGGLIGGLGGYGLAGSVARRAAGMQPSQIVRNANDLNIDLMPADAGGTGTRMAAGVIGRTLGNIPMVKAAQSSVTSARNARNTIARDIGNYGDDATIGQAVRRGEVAFRESTDVRGQELLDAIPIAPDASIPLTNSTNTLASMGQRLSSNSAIARIWRSDPRLGQTAAALQENPNMSWGDLRDFRSIIGEIIGRPSMASEGKDISAMRGLYGALTNDMEAAATAAGPRALTAFRRHNQYWRGRQDRLDNVFSTLLGPQNASANEHVATQLNSWAKRNGGDFGRLSRTLRSMPEEERSTIASTIVARMGRANPGQQTGIGEVFSPTRWATEWQTLSPRAKSVLFPNRDHRQALDRFANVAEGMRSSDAYTNYSMTGLSVNAAAHTGLAMSNPLLAASLAGMEFGAGHLLASPRFARMIGTIPNPSNTNAMRRWNDQLGLLASRDVALAEPIREFQRAMNDNLPRVSSAASPDETEEEKQRRQAPLR